MLRDWRLILTTRGTANIVRSPGDDVHGALWMFTPHHLKLMDAWEGVSRKANRRAWLRAQDGDGKSLPMVTYLGARTQAGRGRPHYILNNMVPGAEHFGLPPHYIAEIKGWLPEYVIGAAQVYRGKRARAR